MLLIPLHGVSDVGIYGLLGGKIATYAAQHDQGISYTLYLLTFALDSVGDVFGSVFMYLLTFALHSVGDVFGSVFLVAAGVLIMTAPSMCMRSIDRDAPSYAGAAVSGFAEPRAPTSARQATIALWETEPL